MMGAGYAKGKAKACGKVPQAFEMEFKGTKAN